MTEINEKEDLLLLDKQLCFPLYACARKIVAAYHPFLKKIGLTYTQYVTMMVIWERKRSPSTTSASASTSTPAP